MLSLEILECWKKKFPPAPPDPDFKSVREPLNLGA